LRAHSSFDSAGVNDAVLASLKKVRFRRPERRMHQYPHELSGGMRQRAVGAIATSCNPRLLLADEPTTALDVTVQARYLDMLKTLQLESGLSMLFITHDLGVVARICNRVAVMYQGRIVEVGDVEQVLRQPSHSYTQTLIRSTPSIHRRPDMRRDSQRTRERPVPVLACRKLSKHFDLRSRSRFRKSHGQVRAVDEVTLQIGEGESVGLVGESGCGKTTLSRMLLQLIVPTSGAVLYRGQDLGQAGPEDLSAFRRAVQPVFQDPYSSLNPRMAVGRIVSEALRASTKLNAAEIGSRVSEVLQQVDLSPEDAASYPAEFSGGQRQRIAIARALASEPALIVLDEAVSSQDVSIRAQILNLLRTIQQRRNLAFLFISHDLSTVRVLCDRVYVMYLGSIVEEGPVDSLYESPRHPYTMALMDAVLPLVPDAARTVKPDAAEGDAGQADQQGCKYQPRCPFAIERCRVERPELRQFGNAGQVAACHRLEQIPLRSEGETHD
jgi:oligopeptide/dipeptide ABC transporter ATP-binding protein